MTTPTSSPRPLPDEHTAFGLAVRLAEQVTSLDTDSATKERVAATQLIRAAIEGRDRMHNERHAALVAALEAYIEADKADPSHARKHAQSLAVRALSKARNA